MKALAVAALSGALFGVGLVLAGMTQPAKVIAFLDVFGAWDPSLAFVMGGAIAVHLLACRLVPRLREPLVGDRFALPSRRDIDARLLGGATLFGVGWGLSGICPGPAITSLVAGHIEIVLFVGAMLGGMALHRGLDRQPSPATGCG